MQNSDIDTLYLNLLKITSDELKRFCPDLDAQNYDRNDIKLCVIDISHRYNLSHPEAIKFLENVVQKNADALVEEVLFLGNHKIINVVESGEPMLSVIQAMSVKGCTMIKDRVKKVGPLGQGVGGEVFEVKIAGYGSKTYAMKKSPVKMVDWQLGNEGLTEENLKELFFKFGVTADIIHYFNPKIGKTIKVPHLYECLKKKHIYKGIPDNTYSTISKGYLCEAKIDSEFYISALVSQAYRTTSSLNFCVHFFDVYSLFVCPGGYDTAEHVMLMDKISGDYKSFNTCKVSKLKVHIQDAFLVQLMFAIAYYQKVYSISHNDLHIGNVFIECINSDTQYRGYKLQDFKYFHYSINDKKNIYVPSIPLLVKIGDYGLAVKYGNPVVGDEHVFHNGYNEWIPNRYFPQYDSTYVLFDYIYELRGEVSRFTRDCLAFLIPEYREKPTLSSLNLDIIRALEEQGFLNTSTNLRPKLERLENQKTAYDLIQSGLFQSYFGKVRKNSVTLGKLMVL